MYGNVSICRWKFPYPAYIILFRKSCLNVHTRSMASAICMFIATYLMTWSIRWNSTPFIPCINPLFLHCCICSSLNSRPEVAPIHTAAMKTYWSVSLIKALYNVSKISFSNCLFFSLICFSWRFFCCLNSIKWYLATSLSLGASVLLMAVFLIVSLLLLRFILTLEKKTTGEWFTKVAIETFSVFLLYPSHNENKDGWPASFIFNYMTGTAFIECLYLEQVCSVHW